MCRVETGGNRRVVDGVLKMTGLTEDERLNVLRNNDQLKKERELGKVFLVSPSPLFPLKYLDMHLALSSPRMHTHLVRIQMLWYCTHEGFLISWTGFSHEALPGKA